MEAHHCRAGVLFTLAYVFLLGLQNPASAQTKVSVVHSAVGPNDTPLWIAQEQGFFARQGLDVQLVLHDGLGVAQRVGKEVPFGVMGVPIVILVTTQGKDLRILAPIASARSMLHFVARPEVKQPADLRGKRVGVSGMGGAFWIVAIMALEHLGLEPQRDQISIVNIGTLPGGPPGEGLYDRTARALESGAADAVILDPARSGQFQAKGYSLLLDTSTANITAGGSALVVDGQYLREHADVVEKVVRGFVEATAFALDPANQAVVLRTLMTRMKFEDMTAAELAYKSFLSGALRKPYLSVDALKEVRRVMARFEPKVLDVPLFDVIDDSFVRRLDNSGALDKLYETQKR
jgi:NitT/TauT family transport system substrate-binding protein